MKNTIQSSVSAAKRLSDSYRKGMGTYLSMGTIHSIYHFVSYSDNDVHDSFETSISQALRAWNDLVEKDALAICAAAQEFSQIDNKLAKAMLGVGERQCSSNSVQPKML